MSLRAYHAKRDFLQTGEPKGKRPPKAGGASKFLYVIQKHAARNLHYDFRLEMEGVLKSWAVPKGMPIGKGEKRLAMEVEDHPVEYANFEGTIPAGNYGGGTVMLWDAGIAEVQEENPLTALRQGKLNLQLTGRKLKGRWALVRMRPDQSGKTPWLLIKLDGKMRPISARADDRSVQTGRTMKQIALNTTRIWASNRIRTGAPEKRRDQRTNRPAATARKRISR